MFKWLFQGKKIALEKANAKRLEQEETNRQDVAGARERVEYLFSHRTKEKGQPFTFADLEAATASQHPARQVSVNWLNDLTQGQLVDLQGDLGRLFAISNLFDTPSGFNFWFGDFTEELKTEIRVINCFITGKWQKVFDTESVLLQPRNLDTISNKFQPEFYREALTRFVSGSDFKPTLTTNLLLWPEASFLCISLLPDKTYKVFGEGDLKEEPFNFSMEKLSELKYLLKEGWDFEWYSTGNKGDAPIIILSVSVPDGTFSDHVKQGGPSFVQQLLDNSDSLEWLKDHFYKRLDYILGLRVPDSSITAHRSEVVVRMCRGAYREITLGDVRRINKANSEGQSLSSDDESIEKLIKVIEDTLRNETEKKDTFD